MGRTTLHLFLAVQYGGAARGILGMNEASDVSLPEMIEVRTCGAQGRGYFAKVSIEAGTTVLESSRPIVWAVNDEHESRNCRSVSHLTRFCAQVSPRLRCAGCSFPSMIDWSFCGAISTMPDVLACCVLVPPGV